MIIKYKHLQLVKILVTVIIIIITILPAPKRAFQQVITNFIYYKQYIYTPTNIRTYIQTQIKNCIIISNVTLKMINYFLIKSIQ
jgi:hypothetical protein